MSRNRETNPHFLPRKRPEYAPQYGEPNMPVQQPRGGHPDQIQPQGRIQRRDRPDHAGTPSVLTPDQPVSNQVDEAERPRYQGGYPPPHSSQPRSKTRSKKRPGEMPRPYAAPYLSDRVPPENQLPISHPPQPSPAPPPALIHGPGRAQPNNQPPKPTSAVIQPTRHRPHTGRQSENGSGGNILMYPSESKTNPLQWCFAVFCVILWLVIILGGLLVLIIYLVYRPRSPHFEISAATLNAALIDYGYRLNADVTLLANFTNRNKKMNVDFSYVVLQLSYGKYHIATQYVEPFSAMRLESRLAHVEMVSSQVRLPMAVSQQLMRQIESNRVVFQVDGLFHTRSSFGVLLRYSYWLYGHCTIVMTGPPGGVMTASKCRTKR